MNESTFEVEVKIPLHESESVKVALLDMGARKLNTETQIDAYFDHPCRSFQDTDEAVRVRRRQLHPGNHEVTPDESRPLTEMTYKGPLVDPISKTRLELSVGLDDPSAIGSILTRLGFKEVAEVTKIRSFYEIRAITVSIDDVVGVGLYLELERIVEGEKQVAEARNAIFEVVRALGLDPKTSIRTSYLEMYLERNPR